MKQIWILIIMAASLSGCARTASLTYVNGNYFMSGDDNCRMYRQGHDNSVISCYTTNREYTGVRYAMSQQEIYAHRNKQLELERLTEDLDQFSQDLYRQSAQTLQQSQEYMHQNLENTSTYTPSQGTSQTSAYCRTVGGQVVCTETSSSTSEPISNQYEQSNTFQYCHLIGEQIICRGD